MKLCTSFRLQRLHVSFWSVTSIQHRHSSFSHFNNFNYLGCVMLCALPSKTVHVRQYSNITNKIEKQKEPRKLFIWTPLAQFAATYDRCLSAPKTVCTTLKEHFASLFFTLPPSLFCSPLYFSYTYTHTHTQTERKRYEINGPFYVRF